MNDEEARYQAIQSQIKELLDKAAADRSPGGMVGLGSVWLAAEMYALNERARMERQSQQEKEDN